MKYALYIFLSLLLLSSCYVIPEREISVSDLDYPDTLQVIKRNQWGWKQLEKKLPRHEIEKITLHHGGVDFPEDKDPAQHLRNLQSWSRNEKEWIDIPYHFMIDLQGIIYEARPIMYPGATNTDYDPTGHALICLMGNYENAEVNREQLDAIIDLMAFLVIEFDVSTKDIKGHKDYTETQCPGKNLYRYLSDETIQNAVKAKIEK